MGEDAFKAGAGFYAGTFPSARGTGVYALGMWVVCRDAECKEPPFYHCSGGRGFLPYFDRKYGYWGMTARAAAFDNVHQYSTFNTEVYTWTASTPIVRMLQQMYANKS